MAVGRLPPNTCTTSRLCWLARLRPNSTFASAGNSTTMVPITATEAVVPRPVMRMMTGAIDTSGIVRSSSTSGMTPASTDFDRLNDDRQDDRDGHADDEADRRVGERLPDEREQDGAVLGGILVDEQEVPDVERALRDVGRDAGEADDRLPQHEEHGDRDERVAERAEHGLAQTARRRSARRRAWAAASAASTSCPVGAAGGCAVSTGSVLGVMTASPRPRA